MTVTQIELFAIDNPCIGVCEANQQGYCKGCLRNRQERQLWHTLCPEQQRHILKLTYARKKRLEKLRRQRQQLAIFEFITPVSEELF